MILSGYLTYKKYLIDGYISESISQTYFNSFVMVNVLAVFCLFKYYINDKNCFGVIHKPICFIGENVFGIYLVHVVILKATMQAFKKIQVSYISPLIVSFIICAVCLTISLIVVYILRRIKVIKKYL